MSLLAEEDHKFEMDKKYIVDQEASLADKNLVKTMAHSLQGSSRQKNMVFPRMETKTRQKISLMGSKTKIYPLKDKNLR